MSRYPTAWQSGLDASKEARRAELRAEIMDPRVIDFDDGEISVRLDGRELRGWTYTTDEERRQKMLQAREYVEGWCDGREESVAPVSTPRGE